MIRWLSRLICALCLLLACGTAYAEGVSVTAKYKPVDGGYRYFFTLYNNTTAEQGAYVWFVEAKMLRFATDLASPSGPWTDCSYISDLGPVWCIANGQGPTYGNWYKGVAPGGSLSGFAITCPTLKESIFYRAEWYNGTEGSAYSGYVYPELVPEPSPLMALIGGLGVLGLPLVRRRRR